MTLGDFNIKVNCLNSFTTSFLDLANTFNLTQHVKAPTHMLGNTLDLILSSFSISSLSILDQSSTISDHFLLKFKFQILNNVNSFKSLKTITFRKLASIDLQDMENDLSRAFSAVNSIQPVENLLTQINEALSKTLDKHAPVVSHTARHRPSSSWFTPELLTAKRHRRACERRLRKAQGGRGDLVAANAAFKDATAAYLNLLTSTRESHSCNLVANANDKTKELFKVIDSLIAPSSQPSTSLKADDFSNFFISKIVNLRNSIVHSAVTNDSMNCNTSSSVLLSTFPITNDNEVSKIILSSHKTSFFLLNFYHTFSPLSYHTFLHSSTLPFPQV